MTLYSLACRNVVRRRGRYLPALVNLVFFGFAFTFLSGMGDSFVSNLEARALVYYGGQGTLLTYQISAQTGWDDTARDPADIKKLLEPLGWVKGVGLRHVYRQPGTEVVGNQGTVTLRVIMGVDDTPGLEDRWDLVAGGSQVSKDSILLPNSVAAKVGAKVGDRVMVALHTYTGQRNTVTLAVSGIYSDDPIFGRGVAYTDRRALNRWSGKPETYGSEDAFWTDGPLTSQRIGQIETALAKAWNLWPHPADKKTFLAQYPKESWTGLKSVVFSLTDHTRDLGVAIAALRTGLFLVAFLLLVVAALGLGSTLRVLLHERTREIGTMRALGMGQGRVFVLLLAELLTVVAVGSVFGAVLGYVGLFVASGFSLSGISLVEPLLIHGTLGYKISILPGILAVLWALGAVLATSRSQLAQASLGPPAQALAEGN